MVPKQEIFLAFYLLCNFILKFVDDGNLNINITCIKEIPCHRWCRRWWWWRRCRRWWCWRGCRRLCKSIKTKCISEEREHSASISFDEIKTMLENFNGNFTLDEGDDFIANLSYCLRFNFRGCSPNVTISVDGAVTNQTQELPSLRQRHWAEAEHNISAILSNFQVN